MDYKINYQYLTKNYLYFYNCEGSVCTSRVKDGIGKSDLFSTYICGYEECPVIKKVLDDSYVILEKDNQKILYNFKNEQVVSDSYEDYKVLNEKYIIVSQNGYEGLIDNNDNILISTSYQQLGYYQDGILFGYNLQNIIVKKNDLYGIVSMRDGKIIEKIEYSEDRIEDLLKIINS